MAIQERTTVFYKIVPDFHLVAGGLVLRRTRSNGSQALTFLIGLLSFDLVWTTMECYIPFLVIQ